MQTRITDMKRDMVLTPGVKIQLEIPKDIHRRAQMLTISDAKRNGPRVPIRDKILEAIVIGIEALEKLERE